MIALAMTYSHCRQSLHLVQNSIRKVELFPRECVTKGFPKKKYYTSKRLLFSTRCASLGGVPGRNVHRLNGLLRVQQQRCFSAAPEPESRNQNDVVPQINYQSPLGELISRLKMVSITGCVLSVCVLPTLVFLKNGDLPSARQATLGTFATIGATGSTAALHFVFGAYVLEMKNITVNIDGDEEGRYMLEATTRSIFGFWKNTHVFDPRLDVTPYVGPRPFANFCANNIPLYVHPEKLDANTRKLLLHSEDGITNDATDESLISMKNEGLATRRKKDDDDELF